MRRPLSLRTRVAFTSAVTAALVVVAMSAVFFALAQSGTQHQVASMVKGLQITATTDTIFEPSDAATDFKPGVAPVPSLGSTLPDPVPRVPEVAQVPPLEGSPAPETSPAYTWVVPTRIGPDGTVVTAAVPRNTVAENISQQRTRIVTVGLAAIVLAASLGWFFAHRAVLPLRRLTEATEGIGSRLSMELPHRPGTTETAELAAAMNHMLERIAEERRHTAEALAAARDFAATSAHELRTPLTAMRTDLQVLRSMPLPERDRLEIIDDVLATQESVAETLVALERLALGELTAESDWQDVDLDETIEQVLDDARRAHPGVAITSVVTEPIRMRGLAAGLRSILDNAVTNSVRHGAATRVEIDARADADGTIVLTVDDDGCGVPQAERERVFERFFRGSATTTAGSGLGLALVAQQARLYDGAVRLDDSSLGGARLRVTLPARSVAEP